MQHLDQAVAGAHAKLERRIQGYLRSSGLNPSCHKGCYACCHALVTLGLAEAEYLRARLSPQILARTERVGHARLEAIARGKGQPDFPTRYFLGAHRCPLLDEAGACSAHPYRPLACRGVLTELNPRYCAPGAVLRLRGRARLEYEHQLRGHHGPEHYLKIPWQRSEGLAQRLWEQEQAIRGFTVIGELATLIYFCGLEGFQQALKRGARATQLYLRSAGVLGGAWGFWVG